MFQEKDYYSEEIESNFLINLLADGAFFRLENEVTEDHFYSQTNKKLFTAIKQLVENGMDVTPLSLVTETGINRDTITELMDGYSPWSLNDSFKYLEELRQKRMFISQAKSTVKRFHALKGYDVAQEIQSASEALSEGIVLEQVKDTFAERTRQHLKELQEGSIKGVKTGISAYDDAVGELFGGELHVLAGFPSVGKSALALQLSRSMAKSGHGVRYFSLEEVEQSYMKRIISAETGFPYSAYRNGLTMDQRNQQNDLYNKVFGDNGSLTGKNFDIDDANDTLESMYIASAKHKMKNGLDVVVIDGATNINHKESNIYLRTEDIAQSLLRMAKRLNITVILLAHINNDLMKKDKDGNKKKPDMSSLMGGQCLTKPAFSVTILDRVSEEFVPNEPTHVQGYLVKSRNSAPNQVMEFDFDGVRQTYTSRVGRDRW